MIMKKNGGFKGFVTFIGIVGITFKVGKLVGEAKSRKDGLALKSNYVHEMMMAKHNKENDDLETLVYQQGRTKQLLDLKLDNIEKGTRIEDLERSLKSFTTV